MRKRNHDLPAQTMPSTTNSFPDPSNAQQIQILLQQSNAATSVDELSLAIAQLRQYLDEACQRNTDLAEALVNSTQLIEDLESDKNELAAAQNTLNNRRVAPVYCPTRSSNKLMKPC